MTCEQLAYLYLTYTYEELTKVFTDYNLPLDYMLRTCLYVDC